LDLRTTYLLIAPPVDLVLKFRGISGQPHDGACATLPA